MPKSIKRYDQNNITAQYDKNATELIRGCEVGTTSRYCDDSRISGGMPCEGTGIAQQGVGGASTSKNAVAIAVPVARPVVLEPR